MKQNRTLWLLLSLLLLLLLLVGCNEGKEPKEPPYNPPEEQTLLLYDASGGSEPYNIIYSGAATESVKTIVKDLQSAIKEATETAPKFSTDTSKLTVESPHEIILGKTIREESTAALSRIKGVGYRIERVDEKIIIVASNDEQLEAAVEHFKQLFTQQGGSLSVTVGVVAKESSDPGFPLMVDGKIPFQVIIPAKGYSDDLYDVAKDICSFFEEVTGESFRPQTDDKIAEEPDAYELCLGNTNRAASQALYAELDNLFEYRIRIDGHRIVIGSLIDSELIKGASMLSTDLARILDGTYAGTPVFSADYGGTYTTSNVAKDFLLPDEGNPRAVIDCGKDSFILYYQKITQEAQYNAYVEKLKASGAKVTATYEMGENLYTLLEHDTYTSYISYLRGQKSMRVYIGSPDDLNPSTEPVKDAKLVKPRLFSMEIDVFAGGADGGMSYAIQLTDGKFLVFDGGYTASDADRLYEVMVKNKPASHAKPIVAGWFVSHLHPDHYGGLQGMANNHANDIVVEGFYYNFPYVAMGDLQTILPSDASSVENAMRKWSAQRYRKLHSGEVLHFSGADVRVICTLEDIYPSRYGDGNDTSTVVQVDIAGQKILFLGDAMSSESAAMQKLGADVLKSDIVQFSHHGYDGTTREVYILADPETILWPMCILGSSNHSNSNMFKIYYETNTKASESLLANKWARESESVKKIIVSGAGTSVIDLPYKPTGPKVVDYDKIYEEQLAAYRASQ